MQRCKKYDVINGPTPAAVILQGTDGGIGHAISILEEYIIDSPWPTLCYAIANPQEFIILE
jgi:hypothetical protein